MKIKKLLALACSVAMSVSIFSSMTFVAEATTTAATATLSFRGYDYAGVATFAVFEVDATIPDTLVPYKFSEANWETTFEDTYEGVLLQTAGFDIPYIEGLTFNAGKSSCSDYMTIQNNTTDKMVSVYRSAPTSYSDYYAGEIGHIATLYYLLDTTSDQTKLTGEYELEMITASINLVAFDGSSDAVPSPINYSSNDPTKMVLVNDGIATAKPSVTLNTSAVTLDVDGTSELTATVAPTKAAVTWASDAESVATVTDGVVTAVSAGTANITATVGSVKATCVVTVNGGTPDPDPQPETVNYTPVADVDGLSAEFLAKYTGKYMFMSDIIGMTGATTESTVKITRGEVSKNTITLGAALGLTGGADVTAEKIVVAVITSEASGEAFTFEIE